MKSGIYGYFRVDGGPVSVLEARALGLDAPALHALATPGALACGIDLAHPASVSAANPDGDIFILVGALDAVEAVADSLNLDRDTPHAILARAAYDRFGEDAPSKLLGEWSAIYWQGGSRTLTLMSSNVRRDPLFYSINGGHVAIAPNIRQLMRLDWVDRRFDDVGLLFRLSTARMRRGMRNESIIRGARAVEVGTVVRINMDSCQISRMRPPEPGPRYRGSFADAMAETDALLRQIVRERLARTGTVAFLVSGGLDSSLLTWLGSEERRAGQNIILLTSAAPPDSGLTDETTFAQIVADHLGLPMERVVPLPEPNIYRPLAHEFECANGPLTSPRHYLYEAFHQAAVRHGAQSIFDGCFGEFSVTGIFPVASARVRARHMLDQLRAFVSVPPRGIQPLDTAFHVKLAAHRLAALPEALTTTWQSPDQSPLWRRPDELLGYIPGVDRVARLESEVLNGQLRAQYPYRDPRLLKLFSGFPARFLVHNGMTRAPVRSLLEGRLPDSIRLRKSKMPISPDYYHRLKVQAEAAIARLDVFTAAGVGDWIDLDWLKTGLEVAATGRLSNPDTAFPLQITAHAAEFFNWWQGCSP